MLVIPPSPPSPPWCAKARSSAPRLCWHHAVGGLAAVRGIEERLGAILIVRGQPCEPTELGRTLCAHLDRGRLLEHDLAPALGRAAAGPGERLTLPIAVNSDSLATWFPAAAAAFGRKVDASLDLALDDEAYTAQRLRSGEVLARR